MRRQSQCLCHWAWQRRQQQPQMWLTLADATPEAAAAATAALPPPAKRVRRMPSDEELEGLEATLQYNFTNKWLLREALIHPNFGEWNNAR